MKANTLNDIYFFGRMLYNEFLQNVHLGPKSNIRFGSTISNVGDLNGDGYLDFAVNAPFGGKDGNGVIYIYNGMRLDKFPFKTLYLPLLA